VVTLHLTRCDSQAYVIALNGKMEVAISLHMQAVSLKSSGRKSVSVLRVQGAVPSVIRLCVQRAY
jgi:hypothetical protein